MKNTSIVMEAIPTPVFWLDYNKTYQGCNQIFSDLIGLNSPADVVGLTDKDLPHSSLDLSIRDEVFSEILSGETQAKFLYDCIVGVQNKMIWVQKRFTPLKNNKGKIIGIFGAIVDISEKVKCRKDLETHVEYKQVLGEFLNELNARWSLSADYKKIIEKSIVTLKDVCQATQAVFINAKTRTSKDFIQFATDTIDATQFFEHKKAFLKTRDQFGYLDPELVKLFKESNQSIDSIFFYRINLNEALNYDNLILLVNPNNDKLNAADIYLSLIHHIVHSSYVSKFLAETVRHKQNK